MLPSEENKVAATPLLEPLTPRNQHLPPQSRKGMISLGVSEGC